MSDNREIVLEALLLFDKGEYADKIIKSILDKYSYLERFERGFINRVFTGTIERRLSLDFIINNFSSVKVNKQKPVIRAILRMSTYQLLFMDSVPDSAVINEAVKLAKKKKFQGLSGFVNGVLRKISKEKAGISLPGMSSNGTGFPFPDEAKDYIEYLSVMYSCPQWLCEHFVKECGREKAKIILENSLKERPVTIRTNISKTSPSELKSVLESEGVSVTPVEEDGSFIIKDFDGLNSLESFNNGLFCVQDLSSQMILGHESAQALSNAKLVIDVCAAPGGKTCHVADILRYLGNDGCEVISRDLSFNKTDKIDENISRCGFDNVKTEVYDALNLDDTLIDKADLVIADLPCSGLGVIGRKADIKYRVTKEDLDSLASLQRDILTVVSKYVRPGGRLIFSTCTVNSTENSMNAKWIEENLNFHKLDEPMQILNDSPIYDGFFISRFERNI